MNLSNFFKDDKILITGASGLVGRNLFELFKKHNLNVVGTYHNNEVEGLTYCDLTDLEQVKEITRDVKYVFLLAAKTYGAKVMKENPFALVTDTVSMNTNVLQAVKDIDVKKIMFVSSSVVYQDSFKPLEENDLDLNQDPYPLYMGVGWVKRYLEKICQFYSQQGLNINIVRPTAIYGKYDKYEEGKSHFVPAIIKRALDKEDPFVVWGTGNDIKNLIYVDDVIRDMLKIMMNYDGVDAFNLCSDDEIIVSDVVDTILYYISYNTKPIYDTNKPSAIPYKSLVRNKLDSILGRENYVPLKVGMREVITWMEKELRRN